MSKLDYDLGLCTELGLSKLTDTQVREIYTLITGDYPEKGSHRYDQVVRIIKESENGTRFPQIRFNKSMPVNPLFRPSSLWTIQGLSKLYNKTLDRVYQFLFRLIPSGWTEKELRDAILSYNLISPITTKQSVYDFGLCTTEGLSRLTDMQISEIYTLIVGDYPEKNSFTYDHVRRIVEESENGTKFPQIRFDGSMPVNPIFGPSSLWTTEGLSKLDHTTLDRIFQFLYTITPSGLLKIELQDAILGYNSNTWTRKWMFNRPVPQRYHAALLKQIKIHILYHPEYSERYISEPEESPYTSEQYPSSSPIRKPTAIKRDFSDPQTDGIVPAAAMNADLFIDVSISDNIGTIRKQLYSLREKILQDVQINGKGNVIVRGSITSIGSHKVMAEFERGFSNSKNITDSTEKQRLKGIQSNVQLLTSQRWNNSRLYQENGEVHVNISRNHDAGMKLLSALQSVNLYVVMEEFPLGHPSLQIDIIGNLRTLTGSIDLLCVDDYGRFVVVDLKTPLDSSKKNRDQKELPEEYIVQVEMYALMFDILCYIHGVRRGIAYSAIIYWDPEDNNTVSSEGQCTIYGIFRGPSYILGSPSIGKNILSNIHVK